MTMFKTTLAAAIAVALGATASGSTSAFADKVLVSPVSNGGNAKLSGPVPAPTFQQIVGSGPVKLGRRPIGQLLQFVPACQSRVCLTGGG
jgi:hypothetical protein